MSSLGLGPCIAERDLQGLTTSRSNTTPDLGSAHCNSDQKSGSSNGVALTSDINPPTIGAITGPSELPVVNKANGTDRWL